MAALFKSTLIFSMVFLLIVSVETEARPFNIMNERLDGFINGWSIGSIKQSGPSPGGEGHKFTDSLGGIKQSGPSPSGPGH